LKDRREQSFSHTKYQRSREIGEENAILFGKINSSSKIDKKYEGKVRESGSFYLLEKNIKERQKSEEKDSKGSV